MPSPVSPLPCLASPFLASPNIWAPRRFRRNIYAPQCFSRKIWTPQRFRCISQIHEFSLVQGLHDCAQGCVSLGRECCIITFLNVCVSERMSDRSVARERNEQCGTSERVSRANEQMSERASGLSLMSRFQDVLNHCARALSFDQRGRGPRNRGYRSQLREGENRSGLLSVFFPSIFR